MEEVEKTFQRELGRKMSRKKVEKKRRVRKLNRHASSTDSSCVTSLRQRKDERN